MALVKTDEERMRQLLRKVRTHLHEELERGYVLTYEPFAGERWRQRHNDLLGEIEQVLGK